MFLRTYAYGLYTVSKQLLVMPTRVNELSKFS